MTKTERVMKWLKDEYGITTEEELDRALERTKLDIGIFVSPLPIVTEEGVVTYDKNAKPASPGSTLQRDFAG